MSYLSGGLDPLPDAEEADDPDQQQTQSQVPFNGADVIDTLANSQYVISTTKQNKIQCKEKIKSPEKVQAGCFVLVGWVGDG